MAKTCRRSSVASRACGQRVFGDQRVGQRERTALHIDAAATSVAPIAAWAGAATVIVRKTTSKFDAAIAALAAVTALDSIGGDGIAQESQTAPRHE